MSRPSRESKEAVNYSRGHKNSHCGPTSATDKGYCRHFYDNGADDFTKNGYCHRVSGVIQRTYWCKRFEKAT